MTAKNSGSPWLNVLEKNIEHHPEDKIGGDVHDAYGPIDVVIFGLGRYGGSMAQELTSRGMKVLGVDFNPDEVHIWRVQGLSVFYGDAADPEFLQSLPLKNTRWVVNTIPNEMLSASLIHSLEQQKFAGKVAVTAQDSAQKKRLEKMGASMVLLPFSNAAFEAAEEIVASS